MVGSSQDTRNADADATMGKPKKERVSRATKSRRESPVATAERELLLAVARLVMTAKEHTVYPMYEAKLMSAFARCAEVSSDSGWYTPGDTGDFGGDI